MAPIPTNFPAILKRPLPQPKQPPITNPAAYNSLLKNVTTLQNNQMRMKQQIRRMQREQEIIPQLLKTTEPLGQVASPPLGVI
jgi:hypothetical protein